MLITLKTRSPRPTLEARTTSVMIPRVQVENRPQSGSTPMRPRVLPIPRPLPGSIRSFESHRSVYPDRTGFYRWERYSSDPGWRVEPYKLGFLYNQVDGTSEVAPKPFATTEPPACDGATDSLELDTVALPQAI